MNGCDCVNKGGETKCFPTPRTRAIPKASLVEFHNHLLTGVGINPIYSVRPATSLVAS